MYLKAFLQGHGGSCQQPSQRPPEKRAAQVAHGWAKESLKAWRSVGGKNAFATRYKGNDEEQNVTAIWDLGDGQVDTWVVPPLIPSDVNENGEIVAKPLSIPRSEKRRKKKKKQGDKEDEPGSYVKVKDPEITDFYLEVKFELQKDRSPIIRMNVIRPMAADKKDIKRMIYGRVLKDMVEKQPQFDLMVEGANHLMLNLDKEEKTEWLHRFEKDKIEDLRQKVRALMNDK